jgi:uncharacterized membrane protein
MKKTRIWELDFLRGFAIVMMIFDHLNYDLRNLDNYFNNFSDVNNSAFNWLNNIANLYWGSELRFFGHIFFVALFLLISGISFTFSKSNLSRGIKLLVVAGLITGITAIIENITGIRMFIVFGIIHMYAFATLITYLFRKIWNNDIFIFTIGALIILYGISFQFWELHYTSTLELADIPGLILGTTAFGADYFGLVPYTGIIMIGTVIGNLFYKNKVTLMPNAKVTDKNVFTFVGRHSVIIFLTHQFVLFGLVFIIGYLFGYRM